MRKVNLFSIGAMRAGSTTLYQCLSQHPEIFMPEIKEPAFFIAEMYREMIKTGNLSRKQVEGASSIISGGRYRTEDTYYSLYSNAGNVRYMGEGSHYFHHPATAKLVHEYNPDAKILVSLRNPIERIYSEYMLYARTVKIEDSFPEFVQKMVSMNPEGHWVAIDGARLCKGFYASELSPWLDCFGPENVKIIFFEDIQEHLNQVARGIFRWLGVDENFTPLLVRAQRGGVPKSILLMSLVDGKSFIRPLLKKMIPPAVRWKIKDALYSKALAKEQMDADTRKILREIYTPHIHELQELIGKDLSLWL